MKPGPVWISSASRWDTASNSARGLRLLRDAALALLCVAASAGSLLAQTTREEALSRLFPGADVRAERVFLTAAERDAAEAGAGGEVPSLLIARYVAVREGRVVGRAYVDTHVVRTKNESLLVSLDTAGRVLRVEVTAFLEPPEYMAPPAWYAQYEGETLTDDLNLHRKIRPIAGASLTAAATTRAVRRILAVDRVLGGLEDPR